MPEPFECRNMTELRAEIDRLDKDLVRLLVKRASFIDRAAQIKDALHLPARIDARVEEVVANVRGYAAQGGLSPDLVEKIWRPLVDWSITREEQHLGPDAQRQTKIDADSFTKDA